MSGHLRRVAPGLYEAPHALPGVGRVRIIAGRHEGVGPRGGGLLLWEFAHYVERVGWVLDDAVGHPCRTLAEARSVCLRLGYL